MTKKKSYKDKLKKIKKDFSKGFKDTKEFIETEGSKVNRYFQKTSANAAKVFATPPPRNRVDLITPNYNSVNLDTPVTHNKVDLVSKPKRLKKIKGNLYWDLR
jgi:hypothetical protein